MQRQELDKCVLPAQAMFQKIYTLALDGNAPALSQLIASGGIIDVRWHLDSPVEVLARQGHHRAVALLIDQFFANINHALRGYAESGDDDHVSLLLKQGANLNYAIEGYARSNNQIALKPFRDDPKLNWKAIRANSDMFPIPFIIKGYCHSGHFEALEDFLNQQDFHTRISIELAYESLRDKTAASTGQDNHIDPSKLSPKNRKWKIFGYALAGNIEKVNALLLSDSDRVAAMKGYAEGGDLNNAIDMFEAITDIELKKSSVKKLFYHLGEGGHINTTCLTQNPTESDIYYKALLHPYRGLVNGEHYQAASQLLNNYIQKSGGLSKKIIYDPLIMRVCELPYHAALMRITYREALLRAVSAIENPSIRNNLMVPTFFKQVKPLQAEGDHHFILQANKINELLYSRGLSYKQLCAWRQSEELRIWMIHGVKLVFRNQSINLDIFIRIATFLTYLTQSEAKGLFQKMYYPLISSLLEHAITRYVGGLFDRPKHKDRAISFNTALKELGNGNPTTLVKNQMVLFHSSEKPGWFATINKKKHDTPIKNKGIDDEFYHIIERASHRLPI